MAPRPFETMDWLLRAPDGRRATWVGDVLEEMRPALERRFAFHLRGTPLERRLDPCDLVHDVFVRVLARLDSFRGTTWPDWLAWCRAIALNVVKDAFRRSRLPFSIHGNYDADRSSSDLLQIVAPGPSPSGSVRLKVLRETIRREIDALDPEDRAVIDLRFDQGLKFREVAARLGCAEDAARMRFNRALTRLGAVLQFLMDDH